MCLKETFIFLKGGYKLQLCIRADYVTLGDVLIGTTNNALGNFVNVLECEFPSDDYTSEKYILNCLQRKRKAVYGLNENGSVLTSFYLFMNGERRRALTLQATDAFRISNNVKVGLPIALSNKADYSNGMVFNVNSAVAVVYALLFYYGFNNLRIVQCGLCDRWFATPNMREKYCSRNALLAGYEHLHCEQAVRNALQNLQRRKKKVYGKLYEFGGVLWNEETRVFTTDTFVPMNSSTFSNWYKRTAEKNDLPLVSLHSFRHLNASLLINSGTDITTVASTLGHSKTTTTLNIYAHAFQKARAEALEAVANVLDNRRKKSG